MPVEVNNVNMTQLGMMTMIYYLVNNLLHDLVDSSRDNDTCPQCIHEPKTSRLWPHGENHSEFK